MIFECGKELAAGAFSKRAFEDVCGWKSERPRSYVASNREEDIKEALRLALDAKSVRGAVAVLTGLSGVGIPMASAILTTLDSSKYTVIDWRALEALGASGQSINMDLYVRYLEYCVSLSGANNVDLRTLDHALWGWSKYRQISN